MESCCINLTSRCTNRSLDPDAKFGENLAGNSGSGSWGQVRSTEAVLTRFVENEVEKEYPNNGHLTQVSTYAKFFVVSSFSPIPHSPHCLHLSQVLWRATKYVGCAETSKPKEGGGMCHVQVCRYTRSGNCNMNKYMNNKKDWWMVPMMMEDSPCGPACPPEGCY